jgi:hypothetical protein
MSRTSIVFVTLFAAACLAIFGFSYLGRAAATASDSGSELGTVSAAERRSTTAVVPAAAATGDKEASSQTIPADAVLKWIAETTNNDPKIRAAAIAALANAPRSQALPILKSVLDRGEPNVDRRLALRSLRTLAEIQGDADGGVRNVLREAIYHSDGTLPADVVQSALDGVESDMLRGTTKANR